MREYAVVSPRFWTGTTGKKIIASGSDSVALALYLVTCPSSNMIGLYYLPFVLLCHEIGFTEDRARKTFAILSSLNFAHYEEENQIVWVPTMAVYQIGHTLKPGDKRRFSIIKEAEKYRCSKFYSEFQSTYGNTYILIFKTEGASCDVDAPPKGHPEKNSITTEQEQEHVRNKSKGLPPNGELVRAYAKGVLDKIEMPYMEKADDRNTCIVEAAIRAKMKTGMTDEQAASYLVEKAMLYKATGNQPAYFWWEAGGYDKNYSPKTKPKPEVPLYITERHKLEAIGIKIEQGVAPSKYREMLKTHEVSHGNH